MIEVKKLVPELRFKGFDDEWEKKHFGDLYSFYTTNSFSRDKLNYENGDVFNIHYGDIHTKFNSHFYLRNEYVPFINPDEDISKIKEESYCKEGDIIIADASEDYADIGKSIELINLNNQKIIAGLHTFLARPITEQTQIGFVSYLLKSWNVRKQIMTIAQGTKVLSLSTGRVKQLKINIPSLPEQQKIASFLSAVDEKTQQLTRKKELLEQYKKGVMQQLFSGKLRFKDGTSTELSAGNGVEYPDWEEKKLGECLDYIQPTKYLVSSTEYDNSYNIPVLTAGKTFILGYTNETKGIFENNLPVIIFDDFTTATKYVDFPFKAKSSAMKILVPFKEVNIKFIYEAMQIMKYEIGGHERHWISKFSQIFISFPCFEEQQKIANFLSDIDKKIESTTQQINQTQTFKKGLLQKMFV